MSGIAVWSRIGGMWRYSSFWPSVFCFDHWNYLFSREDKVEVSPTVSFLGQSYEFLPVKSNYIGFAPTHLRYSLCPPISIPCIWGVGKNHGEERSFFKNLASLVGGFQKEAPSTVITLYYQDLSNTSLMVQFQLLYKFMFILPAY